MIVEQKLLLTIVSILRNEQKNLPIRLQSVSFLHNFIDSVHDEMESFLVDVYPS